MCGIAGWVAPSRESPDASVLRAMTGAIAHRGPDGEGVFIARTRDGGVSAALGHRRLAIIDLVTGDQPMSSSDGRVCLVFNGEIYNFRELRAELEARGVAFRTSSDTEVLLNGYVVWGLGVIQRLRGMFAFALWDGNREQLVLARDGFGKKPLFVCPLGTGLVFASEIKALLAYPGAPRRLDRKSILDYLTHRYVPGPDTLFEGIRKLRPGCYAVWKSGEFKEERYYDPPDGRTPPAREAPPDLVTRFLGRLDEAVQIRLVSDVPLGAFLSGGIDSSAIVSLMSRHSSRPVNTFSVGFEEATFSEFDYARAVAKRFGTNHNELVVPARSVMEKLPQAIRFRDAPVAEPSDIPIYLLAQEAARSVKVILTGEGSDEVLAGYPKHRFEAFAPLYQTLVPDLLHRNLVEPAIEHLPYAFRRAKTLAASFGLRHPTDRLPSWFGALTPKQRDELVDFEEEARQTDPRPFASSPDAGRLRQILYFDQTQWLPDNLLERGDSMTMAASIEARMPFLDREVAADLAGWPDDCRLRGGTSKWVLRQAMREILPPQILSRPKVGFRVPVNEWFRGPLRDFLYESLTSDSSRTASFYRPAPLRRMLDEHVEGRRNHEKAIWTLLNLELFQREYGLS
jgi:asparagine synthase (glutamine-hydrolysing)